MSTRNGLLRGKAKGSEGLDEHFEEQVHMIHPNLLNKDVDIYKIAEHRFGYRN